MQRSGTRSALGTFKTSTRKTAGLRTLVMRAVTPRHRKMANLNPKGRGAQAQTQASLSGQLVRTRESVTSAAKMLSIDDETPYTGPKRPELHKVGNRHEVCNGQRLIQPANAGRGNYVLCPEGPPACICKAKHKSLEGYKAKGEEDYERTRNQYESGTK